MTSIFDRTDPFTLQIFIFLYIPLTKICCHNNVKKKRFSCQIFSERHYAYQFQISVIYTLQFYLQTTLDVNYISKIFSANALTFISFEKYNIQTLEMQLKNKRCTYKKITEDIRKEIIRMFQAKESLKQVAKAVGLNVSTCKGIIKVYQEEGRIGKKLKRKRPVRVIQTYSYFQMNEGQIKRLDNSKVQDNEFYVQKNRNLDQFLLKQSKQKAEQYLNKLLQNNNILGQSNLIQQQNYSNVFPWHSYQNYQSCVPSMNWFGPYHWR